MSTTCSIWNVRAKTNPQTSPAPRKQPAAAYQGLRPDAVPSTTARSFSPIRSSVRLAVGTATLRDPTWPRVMNALHLHREGPLRQIVDPDGFSLSGLGQGQELYLKVASPLDDVAHGAQIQSGSEISQC